MSGVDDGARTHDRRDHNPELYQLSYVHHRQPRNKRDPDALRHPGDGAPGRTRTCDPRLRRPMLYPAELRAHALQQYRFIRVVGAEGFEPPTLCSQSRCATRLRHAPPCSTDRRQTALDVAVVRGPARERESYGSTPTASI
jgi:hypothetical protein